MTLHILKNSAARLQQPIVLMPCVSSHFLQIINAVQELGGYVIATDFDPKAPCHKVANESYVISALDLDGILEIAQRRCVTKAIATSETSVRIVSYVAEKMGLQCGISYDNMICATHKDAMRNRFAKCAVPIPDYIICNDFLTFEAAIKSFNHYCVIKPSDSASSRGVRLIDSAYNQSDLLSLYEETRRYSSTNTVLVEERIDGPEVSVESITINKETFVIAITDKITTPPPYCVETGHTEPSSLPNNIQQDLILATKQAIAAIGLENGPSHTEIKIGKQGVKVIEIGVRPGGDFITSRLVPLSTGFDFHKATAEIGMGLIPEITQSENGGAAIRFISTLKEGIVSAININHQLYSIKGLQELEFYLSVGDFVQPVLSNNNRIGHVLCTGNSTEEAAHNAEKALACIEVSISTC